MISKILVFLDRFTKIGFIVGFLGFFSSYAYIIHASEETVGIVMEKWSEQGTGDKTLYYCKIRTDSGDVKTVNSSKKVNESISPLQKYKFFLFRQWAKKAEPCAKSSI